MEILELLVATIIFIILPLLFLHGKPKPKHKLPPGPRPLPIIGSLHILGRLPHRSLAKLAQKYGPIMSIRLGMIPCIVVSSSETAKLFLKENDLVFASRPVAQASQYLWYGGKDMAFAPYGEFWRNARKICGLHLLGVSKVESLEGLRRSEVEKVTRIIKRAADSGEAMEVGGRVLKMAENVMYKMTVGRGKEEKKGYDMENNLEQVAELLGATNIADFIPLLAPLDIQGLNKKMKKLSKVIDGVLEYIIEDHLNGKDLGEEEDCMSIMLDIMQNPRTTNITLDRENVKAIMLDLLTAGIDPTAKTIEWAFAALLKEPRVMTRLKHELDSVVGKSRMLQESDIPRLPYLDMVLKETLRLYPIGPLLVPRESTQDVVIDGCMIPNKSRIMVNIWAIARDPNNWGDNADEFYPERFDNSDIDSSGQHFEYLPFGAGRRGCPGRHLATITSKFVLARLVHCFDWTLPPGLEPKDIDMTEKFGMTIVRLNKLLAIPSYRLDVDAP